MVGFGHIALGYPLVWSGLERAGGETEAQREEVTGPGLTELGLCLRLEHLQSTDQTHVCEVRSETFREDGASGLRG